MPLVSGKSSQWPSPIREKHYLCNPNQQSYPFTSPLDFIYNRKIQALTLLVSLVAADLLNDRVVPWFEQQGLPLLRILTDRGTEYCGNREHHEYQLYLAIEDIDHSKTRARRSQSNSICERFHKTIQHEFYNIAFRKKTYHSVEELQQDLDGWIDYYNEQRPHSGRYCYGKTPLQTFADSRHLAEEKMLDNPTINNALQTAVS